MEFGNFLKHIEFDSLSSEKQHFIESQ